ncbi:amino acid--tRNA ligase-related protein, partial [Bacillus sp. S1-R5C1-FB]|uniref:amino acid--tRNA ligase-related protein n=1 Tax=Bacillus sp. S1-R5C1-FB TaxID=1973491 RepID=UPI0027145126
PGREQSFKIKEVKIDAADLTDSHYQIQKKPHTFKYLRPTAHLRPRTIPLSATFRVRSIAAFAIHQFFQERGFVHVHTPIITGSDTEGAGEMSRVTTKDVNHEPKGEAGHADESKDFFGKETNLTVRGQLNPEAYALALRYVYQCGPTFRAANSTTPPHP